MNMDDTYISYTNRNGVRFFVNVNYVVGYSTTRDGIIDSMLVGGEYVKDVTPACDGDSNKRKTLISFNSKSPEELLLNLGIGGFLVNPKKVDDKDEEISRLNGIITKLQMELNQVRKSSSNLKSQLDTFMKKITALDSLGESIRDETTTFPTDGKVEPTVNSITVNQGNRISSDLITIGKTYDSTQLEPF